MTKHPRQITDLSYLALARAEQELEVKYWLDRFRGLSEWEKVEVMVELLRKALADRDMIDVVRVVVTRGKLLDILETTRTRLRRTKVLKNPVGSGQVQTLILSKDRFRSSGAALAWVKKHEFWKGKIDEKENTYRFRQFDPRQCRTGFRTFTITDDVQGVVCMRTNPITKAQLLALSINAYDLASLQDEPKVYIAYYSPMSGFAARYAQWVVHRIRYRTGGSLGDKYFPVPSISKDKERKRLEAITWASQKYRISEWEKSPLGTYHPKGTLERVTTRKEPNPRKPTSTMTPIMMRRWLNELSPAQRERLREQVRERERAAKFMGRGYSEMLAKVALRNSL